MPNLENAVTTCPLCLAPDEVSSMVTVEIDRVVPRSRVAVMICRSCTGAVILAGELADPELTEFTAFYNRMKAKSQAESGSANYPCVRCGRHRNESPAEDCDEPEYHQGENDDPSTD